MEDLLESIDRIDPVKYAATRNYLGGAVTRLSPFISRGIVSTRTIFERLRSRGFSRQQLEPLVRELAWRDYWQLVWMEKGALIDSDLRVEQSEVLYGKGIPDAVVKAATGIAGIDDGIRQLLQAGYVHNHQRMYIASLVCNIGRCHWKDGARWMYYHLLDGDWASNVLSWQWVAGTNSTKRYYANQENINRYCNTEQQDTFLDVPYEQLPLLAPPELLRAVSVPELSTCLPATGLPELTPGLPVLVYNSYNLDPLWRSNQPANRILLLEPEHFRRYPVDGKVIDHLLVQSKRIKGIRVFTGSYDQLTSAAPDSLFIYKEHPFNRHYSGTEDPRDWMTDVKGYFPSFFAFWKKAEKELFIS